MYDPPREGRPHRSAITLSLALALALALAMAAFPTTAWAEPLADSEPRVVDEERLDSRTVDLTVASPAMERELPVRLILPPEWQRDSERTWPVLYLLHGGRDDYTSWTRMTDIKELSARSQVIVVMPEAGRAGNYSDWHNYGFGGAPRWETFHLEEVWSILRDGYRAADKRAVAGISSGGYGAIAYAGRHPGMFTAAASYSGLLTTRRPVVRRSMMLTMRIEGFDPYALWGFPRFNEDVWRAHDPLALAENLRGTELYLSSGTTGLPGGLDPPGGAWNPVNIGEAVCGESLRVFQDELADLGIPATVHLYELGTHSWPYWQRELHSSWPMLMESLGVG